MIRDPNLLTATNTVLAISSTKKASTIANTPHTPVSALLQIISTRSEPIAAQPQRLMKSYIVTADRLLITESSDDIAAASTPTMAIPFKPSGNSMRNSSGKAML